MNRARRFLSVLLGLVMATGICAIAAACTNEPVGEQRPYHLVEVEGGHGGGYYYENTNCTVEADVPEGKQFMKWISGGNELSANATYTFTVVEDIKLTAVFADDVEGIELFTLNVTYGTGSGVYFEGSQQEISVLERYQGLTFKGWMEVKTDGEGNETRTLLSTQNPYKVTVSGDMNIVADFEGLGAYATPNNALGQHFRISQNGAYEFDREGSTVFKDGVEYLVYGVYNSPDSNAKPICTFKIVRSGSSAYLADMSETTKISLKGGLGNLYDDTDNRAQIRSVAGIETGKTYYFDVQAFGANGVSEVSVKGPGYTF